MGALLKSCPAALIMDIGKKSSTSAAFSKQEDLSKPEDCTEFGTLPNQGTITMGHVGQGSW